MSNQVSFERAIEDESLNGKFAVFSVGGNVAMFDELETARAFAKHCSERTGHIQTLIVKIEAKFQSTRIIGTVGEDNQFVETGRTELTHGSIGTVFWPKLEDGVWKGGWSQGWGHHEGAGAWGGGKA